MISLSLSLYVTNPRPTPGVLRGRLQIDLTTAPQLTVTKLLSADSTMSMTTSSALERDLESASTLSLTTTGDLAPLWTPVDTELWLDESTIVECDTYVSVWQDKSGNNNDVVQPAAALQPRVHKTLNGLDILTLAWSQLSQDFTITNTAFTVFMVATLNDTSTDYGQLVSLRKGDLPEEYWNSYSGVPLRRDTANDVRITYKTVTDENMPKADINYDEFYIYSSVWSLDQLVLYLNGTEMDHQTMPQEIDSTEIRIGQSLALANNEYWNGDVAEIIIVFNDDTANRQYNEGYLAWKWGLESGLASDHPYKNVAPTA